MRHKYSLGIIELMHITEMVIDHYEDVIRLMQETPGITVRDADSREATKRYLLRNPGLSFVAIDNEKIIGYVMCGHDSRRGYLQHLIVATDYRNKGIGSSLIEKCLSKLAELGIFKTHIDVLVNNDLANQYWSNRGWVKRTDICRYSFNKFKDTNA